MCGDEGLTSTQRMVLGYCGIRYAKAPDYVVCVRQETIAAHLGVRRATVNAAFKSAVRQGWLTKVAVGQRGRGHHAADTWQLVRPRQMSTPNGTPFTTK